MSLKSILADIEADVLKPFGWLKTHGPQLNADLSEAQTVLNDGALVATAAGEPSAAAALNKASGGLTLLEAAVTTETGATNLTAAAAGVTALASGLEPIVGVKDPGTIAAVATALGKVNAVAVTLTNAAAAATAA
jgi:hypothetical protein